MEQQLAKNPNTHNGTIVATTNTVGARKMYIESYGCQMNFSDSEIVASIMSKEGFVTTQEMREADVVLINTCSIRDKAEQTIRKRLEKFNAIRRTNKKMKVGVLGCMAERLKSKLLEEDKVVDMVVGPDAYKDIPNLLREVEEGRDAVNVILSKEETYADIAPVRLQTNGVSALVTITRGCDNMCTFCVVPFTRGRERSRSPYSILEEIETLANQNYKEITLLGQNVDSYLWYGGGSKKDWNKATAMQKATAIDFATLLEMVAQKYPEMRIRFSTSNPQDLVEQVVQMMAKYPNICNAIHLPVQSGSDRILSKMNRQHTRDDYFKIIDMIRRYIPDCGISQDMIAGFPTETEQDHQDTLSLMKYVKYHYGYMFSYSERPGTMAARKLEDDIDEPTKQRRLQEIIDLQRIHSARRTEDSVGKTYEVLIEGVSKKSALHWKGRNSQNLVVTFPKEHYEKGDFVDVKIEGCTSATLIGSAIGFSKKRK